MTPEFIPRLTPPRTFVRVLAACSLAASLFATGCGSSDTLSDTPVSESDIIGTRVRLVMLAEPFGERGTLSNRLGSLLAGAASRTQSATASPEWTATRDRLRRAGLRAVVVPRADLPAIEAALDARPAGSELTLAQTSRWTPIAVGAALPDPGVVRVHDGLLTLGGGRLRLLLRCYAAPWGESPDGTVPAALRVDLVPQHDADQRPTSEFAAVLDAPRVRTIEDSGQILTSLAFEALVGPGEVLLIVPEVPGAVWRGSSADGTNADPGPGDGPSERLGDPGPLALDKPPPPLPPERIEFGAGPKPPRPKTVGEWILTDASDISDATRRLIVVIDPILPREFRLLTPMR